MLRFARFSQFDGAQFWIESVYRYHNLLRQSIHFRQVLLISECYLHIFDFESRDTNQTRFYGSFGVQGFRFKLKVSKRFTFPSAFSLLSQVGDADSFRHLVWPLVCMGPWMSTEVLYCWYHSDGASVLSYFAFLSHLFPLPCGAGSTVPREGFDSSVIMPFSWCVVAVTPI